MSQYLPSLRSSKKNQSQRALPPPEQTSSFVSLEEMPKRVTETSAGAAGVHDPKRLAIQEDPLKEEKDKLKRQIEKLTSEANAATGVERYFKLSERALAEWKLAKLEFPDDLIQLQAARKALVDAEVRHEIESKKQSVMQLLPNATGELKEKLQQQLLDAIEAESPGSVKEIELRESFKQTYPMPSPAVQPTQLPSIPEDHPLVIPPPDSFALQYVDDGNRLPGIVKEMEISLINCGDGRAMVINAEIITGHPGAGKSRLASEVAKLFQSRSPETRITVRINLRDGSMQSLQPLLEKNIVSPNLLAAILATKLFEVDINRYDVNWKNVASLMKKRLPQLHAVALIVDEFNSALEFSERILSACGAVNTTAHEFYVLPIFAGVHRARVPTQLKVIEAKVSFKGYGMSQRVSGAMSTRATVLTSLSERARGAIVESLAIAIDVPKLQLWKALRPILEDCGGWPSAIALLCTILRHPDYQDILQHIRNSGEIGTETAKGIWSYLVQRFANEINILRFAELVSSDKIRKNEEPARYSADHRAVTKSARIGMLVFGRLALLAITGIEVPLGKPILRQKEGNLEMDDPDLHNLTYQLAGSMVEIQPVPSSKTHGKVVMPMIAIAAVKESIGLESDQRLLLNPYENNPTVLEVLAIQSVVNKIKVYEFLGRKEISMKDLREGSRFYGPNISIRVPETCEILQLADHMEMDSMNETTVATESNGRGIPSQFKEGIFYVSAVNQRAIDGGGFFKSVESKTEVIFLSQSKFEMEYVAQSAKDGDTAIAKGEATIILAAMRDLAEVVRAKLKLARRQKVFYVFDIFTTRKLGARLGKLSNPFQLNSNELVILTTKDTVKQALGPILSIRSNLIFDEKEREEGAKTPEG